MLAFLKDDILKSDVKALVVPVNCVGVAGAGLALAVKKQYPDWFIAYRAACESGAVMMGHTWPYARYLPAAPPRFIVSLPTKNHWRDKSDYNMIGIALGSLAHDIRTFSLDSIAVPALGCGCGQLAWQDVKPLIETFASYLPNTRIDVYEPL